MIKELGIYFAGFATPFVILIVVAVWKAVTNKPKDGQNSRERLKESVISVVGD